MDVLKRKVLRLSGYDYNTPGAYFITICVREKKWILGNVVGCGACDAPQMSLTKTGQILEETLQFMNQKYEHLKIDKYAIMPNHFHFILRVHERVTDGASETAAPYNSEVAKFVSLLKRTHSRKCGANIWQRSYYDHVIRGEEDYREIWDYIDANAIKWEAQRYN